MPLFGYRPNGMLKVNTWRNVIRVRVRVRPVLS
jgi:hypothetical protein